MSCGLEIRGAELWIKIKVSSLSVRSLSNININTLDYETTKFGLPAG